LVAEFADGNPHFSSKPQPPPPFFWARHHRSLDLLVIPLGAGVERERRRKGSHAAWSPKGIHDEMIRYVLMAPGCFVGFYMILHDFT